MRRHRTLSLVVGLAPLNAGAAGAQSQPAPASRPSDAALGAARTRAAALLARALVAARSGDVAAAVADCHTVARGAGDAAERYVLLELAWELAADAGAVQVALDATAELARAFPSDRAAQLRALFARLAHAPAVVPHALAVAGLRAAAEVVEQPSAAALTELGAAAAREARASRDPWLAGHIDVRCRELGALRTAFEQASAAPGSPDALRDYWRCLRHDELRGELEADARRRALGTLEPGGIDLSPARYEACDWTGLADQVLERATEAAPGLRSALFRHCLQLRRNAFWSAGVDRSAAAAQMLALTEQLCTSAGVTRLRFRGARDLRQLAIAGGAWQVADGLLVGTGDGNACFATHRLPFRSIDTVVIRGGIRSEANTNFRFAVGTLNVIFNWELADQNHFVVDGAVTTTTPRQLVRGKEHTIVVRQVGPRHGILQRNHVVVLVDGTLVQEFDGELSGTVCVYPALGSEIFVRELLVDGELAAEPPVQLPRGALR